MPPGTSGASSCARSSRACAARCGALMDHDAVRDAAFCQRHREITREHGKEIARERLEAARAQRRRVGRAVRRRHAVRLPPPGDARRVRPRAARLGELDARRGRPPYELEVVQLDPRDGAWLLDKPPLMPAGSTTDATRNGRRASPRRASDVRKGLTMTTHPQKIIDAHCHIGEIPPWKFYDLEHPVKPTVYDYRNTDRVHQEPHGRVQDRAGAGDVQLRRAGARDLVRPQRRGDGRGDDQRPRSWRRSGSRSCRATPS